MHIGILYRHALQEGGYPPDARHLAGALAAQGHHIFLFADPGSEREGIGGAITLAPDDVARLPELQVVHGWGLFDPLQLKVLARVPASTTLVLSPLCQLMRPHLRRSWWKKTPYLAALAAFTRSRPHATHFFSSAERESSLRLPGARSSFQAGVGIYGSAQGCPPASRGRGDYLLFFGRNDVYQKGLDVLVAGYRLAAQQGLDVPLVVAGKPFKSSSAFWRRATRAPGPPIQVLGCVSEDEKWDLLAKARALVYLSRWDGPPRPIRDALSIGTPVIVSRGTNMGDLVMRFKAGRCVELYPHEVAHALGEAADDATVESWGRGAGHLKAALSWDRIAAAYADAYADVIVSR